MADLFPHRARIGHSDYGLDADHWDHRHREPAYPELDVTHPELIGTLWHPDGRHYRDVYDRDRVHFGFQAR